METTLPKIIMHFLLHIARLMAVAEVLNSSARRDRLFARRPISSSWSACAVAFSLILLFWLNFNHFIANFSFNR